MTTITTVPWHLTLLITIIDFPIVIGYFFMVANILFDTLTRPTSFPTSTRPLNGPTSTTPLLSPPSTSADLSYIESNSFRILVIAKARFTRTGVLTNDELIVTQGPYRPGYLGQMLAWTGFAISSGNLIVISAIVMIIWIVYWYRMHAEETLLMHSFGEDYLEYRRTVKKLIPYIC
ncbi:hypothetical protein G9A89_003126 [Geosiphon pyriformis]|nr:hypothetical protein G9A89_003126 [Geosiphon pyriformis]